MVSVIGVSVGGRVGMKHRARKAVSQAYDDVKMIQLTGAVSGCT